MLELRVDTASHVPPSNQLVDAVLDAVAAGALAPGSRLPSVRAAAVQALVNPNTVAKAYKALEQLGVVEGRNGSGVYVRALGAEIAADLRRAATLVAFETAAAEALRAGHPAELLREVLRARTENGEKGEVE